MKTFGDRVFGVAAPSVWNSLLQVVRNSESINIFKTLKAKNLFVSIILLLMLINQLGNDLEGPDFYKVFVYNVHYDIQIMAF